MSRARVRRVAPVDPAARRYALLCNHYIGPRRVDRVIARGLTWSQVTSLRDALQAREGQRPGRRSSWNGRLYIPEVE